MSDVYGEMAAQIKYNALEAECEGLRREVAKYKTLNDYLEPKVAKLRALLHKLEWSYYSMNCPVCSGSKRRTQITSTYWKEAGHAPDCELAKALEGK